MSHDDTAVISGGEHARLRRHVQKQAHRFGLPCTEGWLIGSNEEAQQHRAVFLKLSQCNELFKAPRALCKHEVAHFQARCFSFGNYVPVNFPTWSMRKPKLHMLLFIHPQLAVRHRWGYLMHE